MLTTDTIAAVSTGWGRSARGLVRLSGPGSTEVGRTLLAPPCAEPGRVARSRLRIGPTTWLPCLAMLAHGPRSYTGQDTLELIVPGNPLVLERVMAAVCGVPGVREAGPGEFSARAYLNGKLTLAQVEGVAATIAARSEADLRAAERLASGETGERYRAWVEETATVLALLEAGIDFTDQEDVVPIGAGEMAERLARLSAEIRAFLGSARGAEGRRVEPRVVLTGAPNAGKSTLFNALLGRRRAVVSPVAGTTRDVLEERLDLSGEIPGGPAVVLVDLAGLDAGATGAADRAAQSLAREALADADVLVHCDPLGRFLEAMPAAPPRPVIRVRTKGDLFRTGSGAEQISVCALDGWNLGALRRAIADAAWATDGDGAGAVPRHRRVLAAALERLTGAEAEARAAGLGSVELIAGDLRGALDSLGELTGQVSPDDVIGRIFATFCVGK